MKEKISTPKKTQGCLNTFLIIIGSLSGFIVILGIFAFIFTRGNNDNADTKEVHIKNKLYNLDSDHLFNEKLSLKEDYDHENVTAKYTTLLQNLTGNYSIRTLDYDFTFRKGMKELHVIPVVNNKTNSEKRKVYSIKFGGPIAGHLAFGLKDKSGKKGLIDFQFDSKTNPEKIIVVKYLFDNTDYCQRGVIYDILEHKGNLF